MDLGERDNWERLNNTRNKIRFNKNLSVQDSLNLGIIVLFAPEDCAKERTREALHYFMELEITSKRLEYVLYSVFYCMIDAYFDDEEEYQKVKNMLEQKVSQETRDKFASEIRRENRLMQVSAERDKISAERDEALAKNSEISAERDEAFAFIRLILSEIEDVDDENIKEKISPYRNILKKCNV